MSQTQRDWDKELAQLTGVPRIVALERQKHRKAIGFWWDFFAVVIIGWANWHAFNHPHGFWGWTVLVIWLLIVCSLTSNARRWLELRKDLSLAKRYPGVG